MNIKIINFLKDTITKKGIKYKFITKKTGINYQRLMRIFNQNAIISASELICICKLLEINQEDLIALIDDRDSSKSA